MYVYRHIYIHISYIILIPPRVIDIPFLFLKSEVLTALFKTIPVSWDDMLSAGVGLNLREWLLPPFS